MKTFLKRVSLVIFGVILAILFSELALRIGNFEKAQGFESDISFYYQNDPVVNYDIAENFPSFGRSIENTEMKVWSDNIGCFDSPYNNENGFIFLTGDSFTWGYSPFESKWGTLVEKYTGERVLKCGVPGYGPKQELLKTEKIIGKIQKNPQVIIVGYFYGNDLMDDYLFPSYSVVEGNLLRKRVIIDIQSGAIKEFSDEELSQMLANFQKYCGALVKPSLFNRVSCFLKKHFRIFPFIKETTRNTFIKILGEETFNKLTQNPVDSDPLQDNLLNNILFVPTDKYQWFESALQSHLRNILEFKKFADSLNSKIIFVLIPRKEMIYSSLQNELKKEIPQINFDKGYQIIKNFLDENRITYLDLLPYFKEYAHEANQTILDSNKDLYWAYDSHWNINGNRLAGFLVSKFLLENDFTAINIGKKNESLKEINASLADLKNQSK